MLSEYEARELTRATTRELDGAQNLILAAAGLLVVVMLAMLVSIAG